MSTSKTSKQLSKKFKAVAKNINSEMIRVMDRALGLWEKKLKLDRDEFEHRVERAKQDATRAAAAYSSLGSWATTGLAGFGLPSSPSSEPPPNSGAIS